MTKIHLQPKWLLTAILLVAAMAMPTLASAAITTSKPSSGDGSTSNPYQISSAAHLYWFAGLVNGTLTDGTAKNAAACAKLMANITVNSNVLKADGTLNSGNVSSFTAWKPIGYYNNSDDYKQYMGTFDGNGKTISGLYFNNSAISCVGLFALNGGTVKNVGIVDSYFNGYHLVGGVCGWNYEGTITNCYYLGTVVGDEMAGGICGQNQYSTIANCYFSGSISLSGSIAKIVGGVCGHHIDAFIANCYYNTDKCSEDIQGYYSGIKLDSDMGKTTAQFQSGEVAYLLAKGCTISDQTFSVYEEEYILKGGFYDGSEWGQTIGTETYPVLGGMEVYYGSINCLTDEMGYSNSTSPHKYDKGFCTLCGGYQPAEKVSYTHHPEILYDYQGYYAIENAGQLYWFADQVNKYNNCIDVVLTADITVNSGVIDSNGSLASNTSGFRVWTPIGWHKETSSRLYNGIVDGNNHYISGLYHNDESVNSVGLLGYTNGTVRNLGIRESYFKGGDNVGSMCGEMNGRIYNCYFFNGQIQGKQSVGGLCGYGWGFQNVICNSYFAGTVSGTSNVGSVCGKCEQANAIANCYYDKEKCSIGGIGSDVSGQAEGKTLAQFQSGEVAYLLSQGGIVDDYKYDGSNWGQLLSWTNYPLLIGSSYKVYYGFPAGSCIACYSNNKLNDAPTHTFSDNGFCTVCDSGCQPAEVVSANHHAELAETHSGYYAIENAGQLYWFANQVNSGQTSYSAVLTTNITMNSGVLKSDGTINSGSFTAWTPIGNGSNIYSGTFDGDGKTVSGLYYNDANGVRVGLFGYVGSGGKIKDVGIVDSYFLGSQLIGGVCGCNNKGTIVNCYNKGYVESFVSAGGVVGGNIGGLVTNCYNKGKVVANTASGGICGDNEKGSITNCYNSAVIIGGIGGNICGANRGVDEESAIVKNCYFNNTLSSLGAIGAGISSLSAEGKSADQFKSGEVAYLLAQGTDGSIWGQQLGTDLYPDFSEYKLVSTTLKSEDGTYWATFSNRDNDLTLSVPSGRTLNVYNATVKGGTLRLSERNDCQVAFEEGVLLKTDGEYVNAKANDTDLLTKVGYTYNNLVATPSSAQTITADAGYTLYRLTYNNVSKKEGLGFYLGVVKDEAGKVTSSDGSQLKATPGKAYLKVANSEVKTSPSGAAVRGFVFPDNDDDITGIECITVSDDELRGNGNNSIYDLGGRKVSDNSKGVYIKNNRVVFKLKD